MQTITISSEATPQALKNTAAMLERMANSIGTSLERSLKTEKPAEKPAKEAKPTKKAKADEDNFDLGDEDAEIDAMTEETDDTGVDAEEESEETGPTQEEVSAALAKCAKKHDRAHAMKILAKYKVKTVKDLDEKHYAAVIAAAKK